VRVSAPVPVLQRAPAGQRPGSIQMKRSAGKYAGTFSTTHETKAILNASEARKSPVTAAIGHPRSQHVNNANETFRLARQEKKTKTCYVNDAQQDHAVKEALNTAAGQAALAELDNKPVPHRVVIKAVATGVRNSYRAVWDPAKGAPKPAKKITTSTMTLIIDSGVALPAPDFHIQTAFPL
jgi:hypothetical protein